MEKRKIAEESEKTKKAREKLKKRLREFEAKITEQALENKTVEIHRWIQRHAASRIVLRTKAIPLFDENSNTAKVSRKISNLILSLQKSG